MTRAWLAGLALALPIGAASAQSVAYVGGMPPVMDDAVFSNVLLEQLEDRTNGPDQQFRYDGQGWIGTDMNKLWIKSEGLVDGQGRFTDGQHEALYDRPISTYFDVQAGVRVDLDSGPTRTWAALGVQGLAAYFFDVEATLYASDAARFAARFKASYDLPITQRLILQPEAELNLYSRDDISRNVAAGVNDLDSGLRLRYEISRKFAPYIGVAYEGRFGAGRQLSRDVGTTPDAVRFVFGVRAWF